jgi:hypothetical protein
MVMSRDGRSTEHAGEVYDMRIYRQEYGAMEFSEETARGDLVWTHVFSELRNAVGYSIEFVP